MEYNNTVLGIELGSTRIKAVLLDKNNLPIASGSREWENSLDDGMWTYPMDEVLFCLKECYADLKKDCAKKFGSVPGTFGAMGISGMMHGYLPFDAEWKQLVPFRTWRNTMTGEAAAIISETFDFNIPQRWSIAHLYQAILRKEQHIDKIAHITTLAGYIHFLLTGKNVIGLGEASGMFPIDSDTHGYNRNMEEKFNNMSGLSLDIEQILPSILPAGENAGFLTAEGATLLDPDGQLKPGVPLAPCEGDAGTGMVATNSIRVHTGNISVGTSDFAMLVIDKQLNKHREINMITTPDGLPVALVHCNNCTSDINAWVNLLSEFADFIGTPHDKNRLFTMLFQKALEGENDCGGLLSYNYLSGEGITNVDEGRPVFLRTPNSNFTLANFMRTHILSALSTLKIGIDILTKEEKITVKKLYGHGGFFKTPEVGQRILSSAVGSPISVMETAGEGGPYGMALLCSFMLNKNCGETLPDYLDRNVFGNVSSTTIMATPEEIDGFNRFMEKYKAAFPVEKAAIKTLRTDI